MDIFIVFLILLGAGYTFRRGKMRDKRKKGEMCAASTKEMSLPVNHTREVAGTY